MRGPALALLAAALAAPAWPRAAPAPPAQAGAPAAPGAQPRAAEPALVTGLVRNAWYWQARSREDKAEEAWRRVLAVAPDHPEALAAVGGFEARKGRADDARRKLERLEAVNAGHPDVPVLRRQLELGARLHPLLAEARRTVRDGREEEGVRRYREIFGAAGPPGDLALEYYETVGGAQDGWEEARDGLRRLVRRAPQEARFRLVLGEVLTWRDATRHEGIRLLSGLARHPAVGKEALASWRKALLWLGTSPEDAALLRAYAKAYPGDEEIARRLDVDRRAASARAGFEALERGALDEAERLFEAAGESPDARLGQALVLQHRASAAQRREDHAGARELLERARRLAPDHPEVWEAQLRSVRFWELLASARDARAGGRAADAEEALLRAIERAPAGDRWHADLALADLYADAGRKREAEGHYREVLSAVPDQVEALRALAALLVEAERYEEALPVNERLVRVDPRRAFRPEWLVAEDRRARAGRLREEDPAAARAELEAARRADPANVWVLHDLAGVLLEVGATAEARPVVDELLRAAPDLAEARALEARLLVAEGRSAEALEVLAALPDGPRDPSVLALRRRLEVDVRLPSILRLAEGGERDAAEKALAAMERQVADEPELAARVAVGWARLGAHRRALALMRSAMTQAPGATRVQRLELASALLEVGDEAGVATLLDGLVGDPSLSGDERRWLGELRVAHAIRAADRSRARGEPRAGFAVLDPVLRDFPEDARLLAAHGRLLEATGDPRGAHAAYRAALARGDEDPDVLRGAVDTALAVGDLDAAARLAAEAARLHPEDPRAHLLAARVAIRRGDDVAGARSLRRALALSDDRPADAPQGRAAAPLPEGTPRAAALDVPPPRPGPDPAVREDIVRELEAVHDRHRPALGGRGEARRRSGEPGLGELEELREGVASELALGLEGRAQVGVTFVQLDAGTLSPDAASRLGTGTGVPESGEETGTELRASYDGRHLGAHVGSTPLGFPVRSLVGGARLGTRAGALAVSISGGRRAVTDSVLSYAGIRDPGTGRTWGGVVTEGGRVDVSYSPTHAALWAYGAVDRLVGFNVAENRRLEAGAGLQARGRAGPLGELRAGIAGHALGYDKNLSYFTFGHGGYFSPRRFLHAGVPVGWSRGGRLRWELTAEPGYHWFEEASAWVQPLEETGEILPGRTTQGFAFDGRALLGFELGGGLEAALEAGFQDAPEYREVSGAFVLRYVMR